MGLNIILKIMKLSLNELVNHSTGHLHHLPKYVSYLNIINRYYYSERNIYTIKIIKTIDFLSTKLLKLF